MSIKKYMTHFLTDCVVPTPSFNRQNLTDINFRSPYIIYRI